MSYISEKGFAAKVMNEAYGYMNNNDVRVADKNPEMKEIIIKGLNAPSGVEHGPTYLELREARTTFVKAMIKELLLLNGKGWNDGREIEFVILSDLYFELAKGWNAINSEIRKRVYV